MKQPMEHHPNEFLTERALICYGIRPDSVYADVYLCLDRTPVLSIIKSYNVCIISMLQEFLINFPQKGIRAEYEMKAFYRQFLPAAKAQEGIFYSGPTGEGDAWILKVEEYLISVRTHFRNS
jgi:hypothetical protein